MCKKFYESAYLYDDTASDWGNDGIYFNEVLDFSFEIMSIPGKINPGLYLAEIKPDVGSSNIIQVVYLK